MQDYDAIGSGRLLEAIGFGGVPKPPEECLVIIREDPYNTPVLRELALYNKQGLCSGSDIAGALEYGIRKVMSDYREFLAGSGLLEGADALEITEDVIYDINALRKLDKKRHSKMRYRGVNVPIM